MRYDVLELLNAVHTLGLLFREHETAESSLELLATRTMGHAT